jgi:hypothetical protein
MTEPVPFQRNPEVMQRRIDALHSALDKAATRREELRDERLAEHHLLRRLHHGEDGKCACDGEKMPCRTLLLIAEGRVR